MRAASRSASGMELRYALVRMIFQMEKHAGRICESGWSYSPSLTMSRKLGIMPPEKYMGISR